ncbi:MurR/RpiR family transcriptional regulator [Defluviimonas sp. WL0002]|uniref:MurR/RpiR family transcriptional regulator n=1 Tax=Albidovulum marisflavi TaxID=2984159 RepID=A0ABT2Z8Y3_9RHOB|nr:MurR/RpiR family transcriptional regulator [Defluviimonas sp. WL0002]MCV2867487.1 MurR/RpiR family transcriptional regulator [Defluviimonas sp. WL0002]
MNDPIKLLKEALPSLPGKMAKAAGYALDNPDRIALDSMRTISTACGVTSPTMLRLARKIGYASYEDFRSEFQRQLLERGFGPRVNALRSSFSKGAEARLREEIAESANRNLKQTLKLLDPAAVEAFARAVHQAERTFIIGSGSMHWLAGLIKSSGDMAAAGMILASSGDKPATETIASIGPRDVLLALSLAPYARQTVDAAKFARDRGASVYAITDRPSAPLASHADTVFLAPTASPHYYPSLVAVMLVIETLLAAIATAGNAAAQQGLEAVDRARKLSGAYIY